MRLTFLLEAEDRVSQVRRRRAAGALKTLALCSLAILYAACDAHPDSAALEEVAPQRLVALAPNMVELLFELGLGDRVVGIGDYAHWPPEAQHLPRLGGLLDPHLEEIAQLQPDLVLLLRSEAQLGRHLERLGIPTMVVPADTLAEVEAAFGLIADRCGVEPAGQRAITAWRRALAPRPTRGDQRVLLVVGRPKGMLREVYVAGPDTFLSELAERAGAKNIFADLDLPYPQVGLDSIVARRPDVILELQGEALEEDAMLALKADWQEFLNEAPRVEVISGNHVLVPGPRVPQLLDELTRALDGKQ